MKSKKAKRLAALHLKLIEERLEAYAQILRKNGKISKMGEKIHIKGLN